MQVERGEGRRFEFGIARHLTAFIECRINSKLLPC